MSCPFEAPPAPLVTLPPICSAFKCPPTHCVLLPTCTAAGHHLACRTAARWREAKRNHVQAQAAEAARWEMRTRCEAVRRMITAGDVQGAMDAVRAVDASILKVSRRAVLPKIGHAVTYSGL